MRVIFVCTLELEFCLLTVETLNCNLIWIIAELRRPQPESITWHPMLVENQSYGQISAHNESMFVSDLPKCFVKILC